MKQKVYSMTVKMYPIKNGVYVVSCNDIVPHAALIHGINGRNYTIKNSYYDEKSIEIDQSLPSYGTFKRNRQNYPNITDKHYLLHYGGTVIQFQYKLC